MLFVMPIRMPGWGEYNYLLQCISLWKEKHGEKDRIEGEKREIKCNL